MRLADRRFIQITIVAWVLIYAWVLVQALAEAVPPGSSWGLVAALVVWMGLMSAILTIFVVGIPLRIITNLVLKDRRRSHRSETTILAVSVALLIAYGVEVRRERNELAPPDGVTTLAAFAETMPPPQRLELIQNNGHDYVAWTGELSRPFDVPSGPSCYLFDSSGKLIDWQPVTGDGGPVEAFLGTSQRQRQLTLDEALKMTRDGADPARVNEL